MKSVLSIIATAPYDGQRAAEQIESALVTAAFEMPTALLFRDDGVFCLLRNQGGQRAGTRTLGKMVQGLATYEIENVYVCADSLRERALSLNDLIIEAAALGGVEQQHLIATQDIVMGS